MAYTHWYKTKAGSNFEKEIMMERRQEGQWNKLIKDLSKYLDDPKIRSIYLVTNNLGIPNINELKTENRELFKKDGFLKKRGDREREVAAYYQTLIEKYNLTKYHSFNEIRFAYNLFRLEMQHGEGYRDWEGRFYYASDYVPSGAKYSLTEITQVEYTETYLKLIKEQEQKTKEKEIVKSH